MNIATKKNELLRMGNRKSFFSMDLKKVVKSYQLYLFLLPTLLYIIIFEYGPMYGVAIAFVDFKPHLGILGSPWAGLKHFYRFFQSPNFWKLIQNTLSI